MIKSIIELNGIPLWFVCFSALFATAFGFNTKKWIPSLLIGYLLIILGETLLFRTPNKAGYEFTLFWSYVHPEMKHQIVANILLFIPFGFLDGTLWGWKAIPFASLLSFYIEAVQLVFCMGFFEIDDIFHNTVGSAIGYLLVVIIRWMTKKHRRIKQCS